MTQKTFTPKALTRDERKWYVVDAADKVVGRLATDIANILRGKNKATFTPHMDMGDYVVVINAEKIRLSGNKEADKNYYRHSGYLGHLKVIPASRMREKHPTRILEEAISGMLPKNRLRKHFLSRLNIYAGQEHPHQGQNPTSINL